MRASLRAFCGALGVGCLLIPLFAAPSRAGSPRVHQGRVLFERVWEVSHDSAADGLGPVFNERSCVACHSLGGIGGAGGNNNNVDLLTPSATELRASGPADRYRNLHVGFETATSVVLHRFSTQNNLYQEFRGRLMGFNPRIYHEPERQRAAELAMVRHQKTGPNRAVRVDGVEFIVSRRNTTPLFGLGLIDRIPEHRLRNVAFEQRRDGRVSGRVSGRFGWRGQVLNLEGFVRSACATELGLHLSTHNQPWDPVDPGKDKGRHRDVDISDQQCRDLTAFVSQLPRPRRLVTDNRRKIVRINNGEESFEAVGCADCHRPTLAHVSGLYSDLLVHDMGPVLADPAPAPVTTPRRQAAYYENTEEFADERILILARREWKTPPLWGLRDSAPYLHDGRAKTVEEAISLHGGEAEYAVIRYRALSKPQQQNVLAFLATLAAPAADELAQTGR